MGLWRDGVDAVWSRRLLRIAIIVAVIVVNKFARMMKLK